MLSALMHYAYLLSVQNISLACRPGLLRHRVRNLEHTNLGYILICIIMEIYWNYDCNQQPYLRAKDCQKTFLTFRPGPLCYGILKKKWDPSPNGPISPTTGGQGDLNSGF